jgi:hypothetical protein
MKKIIFVFLTLFTASMLPAAWDAQKTDAFIQDMVRAIDPDGNCKNIKSFEIANECMIQTINIKMQSQLYYKIPGKMKNIVSIPGMQTTTIYFDGQKGVKVDSLAGITPLEGKVLEETKFMVMEMHPVKNLRDIFDKIEIEDKSEIRDGKEYIVVNCYTKPETGLFPKKYLVDPVTKYIIYSISKTNTEMGIIESTSRVLEYKKIHGLVTAVKVEQNMMNMKIINTLKYININTEYPDSFFEYKE